MRVDEKTGLMLRPNEQDSFVVRRAAELALPEVKAWLKQQGDGSPEEEIIDDLIRVGMRANAYELAKRLEEQCGYMPDGGLCEILDGDFMRDAINEMTKKWVLCVHPPMPFCLDAVVKCMRQAPDGEGVVTKLIEETASYGVHFATQRPMSAYYVVFSENVRLVKVDSKPETGMLAAWPEVVEA